MKMKKRDKNFINFSIKINNQLLTSHIISKSINTFWTLKLNKLQKDDIILLLFKVRYHDGNYATLAPLQKINNSTDSLNKLKELFVDILEFKDEEYKTKPITNIIFTFLVVPFDKDIKREVKITPPLNLNKKYGRSYKLMGYNLPTTMDLSLWGETLTKTDKISIIKKINTNFLYIISTKGKLNEVKILKKGNKILEFTDLMTNTNNNSTFIRTLKNKKFYFDNSKLVLKTEEKINKFIKQIKADKDIKFNVITLDIETRIINGSMEAVCLSFYDGKKVFSFFVTDYRNSLEMLSVSISSLLINSYKDHTIYVHNFSEFDSVFLMKLLAKIKNTNLKVMRNNDKWISTTLTWGNNHKIIFKDSLLMLPINLRDLGIAFKIDGKSIFPYKFLNYAPLNYIGKVPDFKYFTGITENEFNNFVKGRDLNYLKYKGITLNDYKEYCKNFNNNWNLKNELIKYCNQDCITLYQVLEKFNSFIFDLFNLNIEKYPTLPSLSFGIYRSKYLNDFKIPIISGIFQQDLKKSYTGGATDVYKPHGYNINGYDCNSLYSTSMETLPMPVGNMTYFEGDISKHVKKPFGFFEVEVTAPDNLYVPIIQTRIKTKHGNRTIAPLGNWIDMLYSEEIFNAQKHGYKFNILRGYLFDKEYIFSDYVNDLYQIKQEHKPTDPLYLISKLLLNSLYGRFGLNFEIHFQEFKIINNNDIYNLVDNVTIKDIIYIDKDKKLVSIINEENLENSFHDPNFTKSNSSVIISSAITSLSRIFMGNLKIELKDHLYYSDTDSLYIDIKLPDHLIGKGLGKFKLENEFNEAIFLTSKVYSGKFTKNNNTYESTKIKGYKPETFKDRVSFDSLKNLLIKDSHKNLYHEKWFNDFNNSTINVKNQIYTLSVTDNKRKLIYDENNVFINTTPFIINKNKEIIN